MKIYVAHASCFDYKSRLYLPLQGLKTYLPSVEFIFPHLDNKSPSLSSDIIKQADWVLAEVSYPSTGLGIELGWAHEYAKPIYCYYQRGKTISTSVELIADMVMDYSSVEDLIMKVKSLTYQE